MTGTPLEIISYLYTFEDKEQLFDIQVHRKKRSLSQNAYAWELIGKIASALQKTKKGVYLELLRDYGKSELVRMKAGANPVGYVKYYEIKKTTPEYTDYILYKGSSEFDTKEMSDFIDGILQECDNLDIPTLKSEYIKSLELN